MSMQQDSGNRVKEAIHAARLSVPVRWLREAIAIIVWISAFTQLFVVDLGSLSTAWVPPLAFLVRYRFLILLGIVALLWPIFGKRRFLLFLSYVIAYPFVIAVWIIPRLLFRNWAVVIAFSPAIYSIVSTFRASFILFSAATISSFVICLVDSPAIVISCKVLLVAYLAIHYFRRFRVAFSPSTVFANVGAIVRKIWDSFQESSMAQRPVGPDPASDEYKQKFGQNLLSIYMVTTVLHFLGERLREVVSSRKLDLYFVGSLLYTFCLTLLVFAIEYFGLERLAPGSFTGIQNLSLLDFLGFSFNTFMTADLSPLRPVSGLAQAASYLELFGSLLLIVLLVFVILTSIRERYQQDLDSVVDELGTVSKRIESQLEANYELTIAGAEAWLLEFNPVATRWVLKLRYGEQRVHEISNSVDDTS